MTIDMESIFIASRWMLIMGEWILFRFSPSFFAFPFILLLLLATDKGDAEDKF